MGKQVKHRRKRDEEREESAGPAIRSFWSGTISFGLVSVPVEFFPATRTGTSLRMLSSDGTPLARRYYCPKHGKDVHPEHILRGYELPSGEYVIVRDEELESLEPKKTREIDLRQFVDLAEISPAMFERGYYLAPSGDSNKAYRLLAAAMEHTQRAGIASFVMRDREYLVAIVAERGILSALTLRFHDELRTPEDVGLPDAGKGNRKAVADMRRAIRKLAADDVADEDLQDRETVDLRALAEKKLKRGEDVIEMTEERPARDEAAEVDDDVDASQMDLLEVIRASLKSGKRAAGKDKPQGEKKPVRHAARSARKSDEDEPTKDELYREAQDLDIEGRADMSKAQLMRAVARRTRPR